MMDRLSRFCGVAAVTLSASGLRAQGPVPIRVIAYEDGPTPVGGFFRTLALPEVGADEGIIFRAEIAHDPNIGEAFPSIWIERAGLSPVVLRDDPVPGIPDSEFKGFGVYPRAGAPGEVLFTATIFAIPHDDGTNEVVCGWDGTASVLAREGSPAPSLEPLVYGGDFVAAKLGKLGHKLFWSLLRGDGVDPTNENALFYAAGAGAELLVRTGVDFSADHPGVYVTGTSQISVDSRGRAAFQAALSGPNVQPENDSAIILGTPGQLSIVVRRGTPAHGLGFLNYGRFNDTSISGGGELFYHAELNEPDMTSWAGEGLWYGAPDAIDLVVLNGMKFQGTNIRMHHFAHHVQNDAGDLAFVARLVPNERVPCAIAVRRAGSLVEPLAMQGEQAPGTEPGVVFSDTLEPEGPFLSEQGNVAFIWWLEGPGVDDTNNSGLWATDADANLTLVLRSGEQIEVADGDVRTVERIFVRRGFYTGTEGNGVLGPEGTIGLAVRFTDDTHAVLAAELDACPADFNADGTVNTLDVLAFLNAWSSGDSRADFNGDGSTNTLDVLAFLNAFAAGC